MNRTSSAGRAGAGGGPAGGGRIGGAGLTIASAPFFSLDMVKEGGKARGPVGGTIPATFPFKEAPFGPVNLTFVLVSNFFLFSSLDKSMLDLRLSSAAKTFGGFASTGDS